METRYEGVKERDKRVREGGGDSSWEAVIFLVLLGMERDAPHE